MKDNLLYGITRTEVIDTNHTITHVIGVCNTPDDARKLIKEYYGVDSFIENIVQDSGIELTTVIAEDYVTVQLFYIKQTIK